MCGLYDMTEIDTTGYVYIGYYPRNHKLTSPKMSKRWTKPLDPASLCTGCDVFHYVVQSDYPSQNDAASYE